MKYGNSLTRWGLHPHSRHRTIALVAERNCIVLKKEHRPLCLTLTYKIRRTISHNSNQTYRCWLCAASYSDTRPPRVPWAVGKLPATTEVYFPTVAIETAELPKLQNSPCLYLFVISAHSATFTAMMGTILQKTKYFVCKWSIHLFQWHMKMSVWINVVHLVG